MASKADQLSNTNYFIVLILISLLVIGVAGLVGKTLVVGIVRDTKVLVAKNKANHQLDLNLQAAPELVANYEQLGDTQKLIDNSLPNTSDLPGLMALMENMSGSVGLSMKSIGTSQSLAVAAATPVAATGTAAGATGTVETPAPKTFDFTVAFDGNYPALKKLLDAMEKSARPMQVKSIQLSGSNNSLSIQMEGRTYYQDKATLPFKMETVQ